MALGTGIEEFWKLMLLLLLYGIVVGIIQMVTVYNESKDSVITEYERKLGLVVGEIRKEFRYQKLKVVVSNILEVLAFGIVLTTYRLGNQGLFVMMVELGIALYLLEVWIIQKTMSQDLEWISKRVVAAKVFKNYANPQLLGKLIFVLTEKSNKSVMKDEELRLYLRNMVKFRNREVRNELNYIMKRYENKERMVSISKILLAEKILLVDYINSEGSKEGLFKVFKEMNEYILSIPLVSIVLEQESRNGLISQEEAEKELKVNTGWLTSAKFYK